MSREVTSTLRVLDQADVQGEPGPGRGETYQKLIGVAGRPTDRVRLGRATYVAGAIEELHWHPIEALYYVVSGHGVVRDIAGEAHPVGPGSVVYAPAGIAGAHRWEVHEGLELLDIRATNATDRKLQFTVDPDTKRSFVDLDELARREAIDFTSHY